MCSVAASTFVHATLLEKVLVTNESKKSHSFCQDEKRARCYDVIMIELPLIGSGHTVKIAPTKIIAVGLNYRAHVDESAVFSHKAIDAPSEPVLFAKTPNVLIGPGQPICIPSFIHDYGFAEERSDDEAELALIVGAGGKNIDESAALDHLLGYTCFNDVSQRNIQKNDASGWFRGKSFDSFGPIGPVVVPVAKLGDGRGLRVQSRVNGRPAQDGNTTDMIFPVKTLIAYISRMFTLEPGDIIATGTPSGVVPIHPGDSVEIEIAGIGILQNPVQ
jgi:2-keto-4-pentenoate hydratase/2-oxohepta-3-ene-1,7-dioic acid hydratase in catechol pathway